MRYRMWGGFVMNDLHWQKVDDRWGDGIHERTAPAIFRTRKEAREQYEDVREVFITTKERGA